MNRPIPALEGKTVAGAYYYASGTFAANPHSASMDKYLALGMVVHPPLLKAKPEGSPENTVSREQMDTVLNADYLTLSFDTVALRTELVEEPIYQQLTAVKNETVQINEPGDALPKFAGNNPTLLNIPWVLDQQRETLARLR